jgi:chorismate mutase
MAKTYEIIYFIGSSGTQYRTCGNGSNSPMEKLALMTIAEKLEALEETILFKIIDRAQFRANSVIYTPGKSGFNGAENTSLFEIRLRMHEEMDALFGRFCVPEERPFYRGLPAPKRSVHVSGAGLAVPDFDAVNVTKDILRAYQALLSDICDEGDDGHYGSSVEHDVYALQAIGRRVHFGALYVAECKYAGDPASYRKLVDARDTAAIEELLTRKEVEDAIIERVGEKAIAAQANVNRSIRHIVEAEPLIRFYRDCIIPLTKKGEVLYLLNRKK